MPINDKHRHRLVEIEFESEVKFNSLPYTSRMTLVFVKDGNGNVMINDKAWSLAAPCIVCLSQYDRVRVLNNNKLSAISFNFNPMFINSALSFEELSKNNYVNIEDKHDRNMLGIFLKHSVDFPGIIPIPPSCYNKIHEWIEMIGYETTEQSDGMWTCRIRKNLLLTLFLVNDIYMDLSKNDFNIKSSFDLALDYIHTNYQEEISLGYLCKIANLNRTSLNRQFKDKVGCTAIEYLINYRLKLACKTLQHTNLKLQEIAESCGFKSDTYFIKQFSKKFVLSPTEYRENYL